MTSEIVIIGGGVIGLAIAIELKLRGTNVTVFCRNFQAAATHAAAGMLAPDAENIPNGAMRSLCWRSRALYPDWTHKLEELTGLNTGYRPCGILTPFFEESRGAGSILRLPSLRDAARTPPLRTGRSVTREAKGKIFPPHPRLTG